MQGVCLRKWAALGTMVAAFAVSTVFPTAAHGAQDAAPASAPVQPPPARPIAMGQSISSSIDAGQGRAVEDFLLRLEANQGVIIDLVSPAPPSGGAPTTDATPARAPSSTPDTSPAPADAPMGFDTHLELRRLGAAATLATNDDRGDGTLNSRIIFTAPAAGDYVIRVTPLGDQIEEDELSSFQLSVTALPPAPAPREFTGDRVEGSLDQNSPISESFGRPARYDAYWIQGAAGERIQIDMVSTGQGPGLQLVNEAARVVASNVGRNQTKATLITVLPEAGQYRVRAQTPDGQAVRYSLNLARATESLAEEPGRIGIGETAQGTLNLRSAAKLRADGSGQIDYFYKLYALDVQAGETITVSLDSADFDATLDAGRPTTLGFDTQISDNNSGEGNNARLVLQPLLSGTVHLRARSSRIAAGSFTLSVVRGLPPRGAAEPAAPTRPPQPGTR